MGIEESLRAADLVLTEGSMYERLRRHGALRYDEHVAHAGLIYDERAAALVADVHREYIAVAQRAGLPLIVGTATWRASRPRLERSRLSERRVNQDNVTFIRELCVDSSPSPAGPGRFVAATLGPIGDAYKPEEGLDERSAQRVHAWHADACAEGSPDLLIAYTLPAAPEARGLARAMEATGLPYMLSFVIRDDGALLDGTPLPEVMDEIDQGRSRPPLGYGVNCVHPAVLERAESAIGAAARDRLLLFRANTADRAPEELDAMEALVSEAPEVLAPQVASAKARYGLSIVGGCCGTGTAHLAELADRCR